MSGVVFGWLEQLVYRRSIKMWRRAALEAETADKLELTLAARLARDLQDSLNTIAETANRRTKNDRAARQSVKAPKGARWAWRPSLWCDPIRPRGAVASERKTSLGDELTLFHDCNYAQLSARQVRNGGADDLAPFGLALDIYAFEGSFFSLVIDLPPAALEGLKTRDLIRLEVQLDCERPVPCYTRLNVLHGPNTEQVTERLDLEASDGLVEFDLLDTAIDERRITKIWVDLIFDTPAMNQIRLRDLTFSRYPRADM